MGEFFSITRKLTVKDAEQLIENGLGDNELVLLLDYVVYILEIISSRDRS